MRCVIFVAAIVLLVIAADAFEFGDIIYYEPTPLMLKKLRTVFKYRHVLVYVGDHDFPGKQAGQTVFERLREGSECRFAALNMTRNPVVCNYLDGYEEKKVVFRRGTDADIEGRIRKLVTNCGKYNLYNNNCEHLATYVRYGKKIAMQEGLNVKGLPYSEGVTRLKALKFIKAQKKARRLRCNIPTE